ncbi:Alpha/Beta hydrolase protein [Suillus subaureus]|uniref:Carboxypeptidase n=1 Tax=Suillus subaureus TaxID=48587 RepID=A0A9P7JEI9_9AGAM|nr:Alpha/Beta hydrolase protein [Suillus subaureus]KAG1817717.1 Alpha/Beta hydrolase protein [Suillus subaureus]
MVATSGHMMTKHEIRERQLDAAKRWQTSGLQNVKSNGVQNITFTNPKASEFYVDGRSLPLVDFDVGPSWAGLLPISNSPNETRQLFFWFFPPGPQGSLDDLIFWTNGGPGCSSLEGLLQENGVFEAFQLGRGQAKPTVNQWSWTNLSSVLWVEQPVGTGFSQGIPNARNEDDVAAQLVGFMQQFLDVFSELKGKKLYLTGESYAGTYVPCEPAVILFEHNSKTNKDIANYIYENSTQLDLSLQGIWINDPYISWWVVQQQIPAVDFVKRHTSLFSFKSFAGYPPIGSSQTFMNHLEKKAATCNYTGYMDKHVTYPPAGLLPLPGDSVYFAEGCNIWDDIYNNALIINPAFNIYHIWDTYPTVWDVLGLLSREQESPIYFNRMNVKVAIHAPVDTEWSECSSIHVFPNRDSSLRPAFSVLPNVIEKNQRTVIVHGLADFILIADGTRIAIQNMTWDGLQGFQTPIANDSFIVDGVGAYGTMHSEWGLTYYEVALSGHMVPQFAPVPERLDECHHLAGPESKSRVRLVFAPVTRAQALTALVLVSPWTQSRPTKSAIDGRKTTTSRASVPVVEEMQDLADLYDFTRTIPCGRVTTYKDICVALGQGSPRSVGSALRNNPFAPFVPCHRIIASNLYIGGFSGEWGTGANARGGQKNTGSQCNRKMEMLAKEGVTFSVEGYLADESLLWIGRD